MPKFDPRSTPDAYRTLRGQVRLLLERDVNWVPWAPGAPDPTHIQPLEWDGWELAALPNPYSAHPFHTAWRQGYCCSMADGGEALNPYLIPHKHGTCYQPYKVRYAWFLGWVTGEWTKEPGVEPGEPWLLPENYDVATFNRWYREVLRPLALSGQARKIYDRLAQEWRFAHPDHVSSLCYPPVIA